MADLYTQPYSNTSQGTQFQALNDALAKIQGSIPQPQQIQGDMQNIKSQYNVANDSNYLQKIADLYGHDANLSQQFQSTAPNATPGGSSPTDLPPRLNLDNVGAPFSGFNDPALASQAGLTQIKGAGQTVSNIADLISKNYDAMNSELKNRADVYGQSLGAKQMASKQLTDLYTQMMGMGLTAKDLADLGINKQNADTNLRSELLKEWQSGYTGNSSNPSQDLADQFIKNQISWDDIPSELKAQVTKAVSSRGTTVQKVRDSVNGINNSLNTLDDIFNKWQQMGDLEKRLPQQLIETIPGISPTRAGITSLFYSTLEPSLRQAAIGGRITQQEINWIRGAILPSPTDTMESAMAKVQGAKRALELKLTNPSYNINQKDLTEFANGGNSGSSSSNSSNRVQVVSPEGKVGTIDSSELPMALQNGWKQQ